MIPDLLSTLIGLLLVCLTVLDAGLLEAHRPILALAGAILAGLGMWSTRVAYLKWPGAAAVIAGIAIFVLVVSGIAAQSSEMAFWVVFWSGNVAGVLTLWSALYRGPEAAAGEPS